MDHHLIRLPSMRLDHRGTPADVSTRLPFKRVVICPHRWRFSCATIFASATVCASSLLREGRVTSRSQFENAIAIALCSRVVEDGIHHAGFE